MTKFAKRQKSSGGLVVAGKDLCDFLLTRFLSTWLIADRPFPCFSMDYEPCQNLIPFLPHWGAMSAASGTPKLSRRKSSPKDLASILPRSEERRVGKECRS